MLFIEECLLLNSAMHSWLQVEPRKTNRRTNSRKHGVFGRATLETHSKELSAFRGHTAAHHGLALPLRHSAGKPDVQVGYPRSGRPDHGVPEKHPTFDRYGVNWPYPTRFLFWRLASAGTVFVHPKKTFR